MNQNENANKLKETKRKKRNNRKVSNGARTCKSSVAVQCARALLDDAHVCMCLLSIACHLVCGAAACTFSQRPSEWYMLTRLGKYFKNMFRYFSSINRNKCDSLEFDSFLIVFDFLIEIDWNEWGGQCDGRLGWRLTIDVETNTRKLRNGVNVWFSRFRLMMPQSQRRRSAVPSRKWMVASNQDVATIHPMWLRQQQQQLRYPQKVMISWSQPRYQ